MSEKGLLTNQLSNTEAFCSTVSACIDYSVGSPLPAFFGNRCGHVPSSPKFFQRDPNHKNPIDVLVIASKAVEDFYFKPKEKNLCCIQFSRYTDRQLRSERREAIASVARVLINHVHLATMQIVQFISQTQYRMLQVREIARKAGIGERRCARALEDLKNAGYLKLQYRFKVTQEGEVRAQTAIKTLSDHFFYHLGISAYKLSKCQQFVRSRWNKLLRKRNRVDERLDFMSKKRRIPDQTSQHRKSTKPKDEIWGSNLITKLRDLKHKNQSSRTKATERTTWFYKKMALLEENPNLTEQSLIDLIGPEPSY